MDEAPKPKEKARIQQLLRLHRWLWKTKLYIVLLALILVLMPLLRHEAMSYDIRGIDVSRYQKELNWAKLKEQDRLHFIFMKATEGRSYVDPTFRTNWPKAKAHDLIRGAYHFYRPGQSALWQARHFTQTVTLRAGDLPPVLDVEEIQRVPREQVIREVGKWLDLVEQHYGIRPIIYTSQHWHQAYLGDAFPKHHFWVARYSRCQPRGKWTFWQYSSSLSVPGIQERVDGNVFIGTRWALESLCL